jgi:hypothetical protein
LKDGFGRGGRAGRRQGEAHDVPLATAAEAKGRRIAGAPAEWATLATIECREVTASFALSISAIRAEILAPAMSDDLAGTNFWQTGFQV